MEDETSQITEKEALSIYAKMMHTLDSSEFESFLPEDFSYSSQKVLTDMNSKDEFIAYIRPKLETIKKTKSSVYAELSGNVAIAWKPSAALKLFSALGALDGNYRYSKNR